MYVLLEKIYGSREDEAQQTFTRTLTALTSGIDAEIKFIDKDIRNWIQVDVSGPDSTVVINYLRKRFGIASSFMDIQTPRLLRGKIIDSGKVGYGLYVDVGLSSPDPVDALVPLHSLRSHLADGRRLPLQKIIDLFCLHDNCPLSIRLTTVERKEKKLWAVPSDGQIALFRKWLSNDLDRVVVLGAYLKQITLALRKSRLRRDIVKVDELGFLEHSILCKLGTDAPGVIKILGQHLPQIPLYAFSPSKARNIVGELPPNY